MYYSGLIIYKALAGNATKPEVYEESVILLEADNEAEALKKAHTAATAGRRTYRSAEGKDVVWSVEKVVGVCEILDRSIVEGVELHSRYFKDLDAYRRVDQRL